jgi:hypothetical protein
MSINLDIELALLHNGNTNFEFETVTTGKTLEQYLAAIVNRNIFGPKNNTPIVTVRPNASYASGSEIKITLRGEDGDKDDKLEFVMLNSEIEGAKLESRSGTNDATLILPPTASGTYGFKVGVKDSGFPAKESDAEFKVVLKDPPNKKPSVVAKLSNPYAPDKPIEVILEGTDSDAKDILEFAIVEGLEGAKIEKQSETDRNPRLLIPPQLVGSYPFVISVRDGREESVDKPVEKSFELQVVRKFSHLNETRITGILRDKSGTWFVNVRVRTTGQRFSLAEGESFEVEKKTFKVEKVETNQVTFQVGDQQITRTLGQPFGLLEEAESVSDSPKQDASTQETASKNSKS